MIFLSSTFVFLHIHLHYFGNISDLSQQVGFLMKCRLIGLLLLILLYLNTVSYISSSGREKVIVD